MRFVPITIVLLSALISLASCKKKEDDNPTLGSWGKHEMYCRIQLKPDLPPATTIGSASLSCEDFNSVLGQVLPVTFSGKLNGMECTEEEQIIFYFEKATYQGEYMYTANRQLVVELDVPLADQLATAPFGGMVGLFFNLTTEGKDKITLIYPTNTSYLLISTVLNQEEMQRGLLAQLLKVESIPNEQFEALKPDIQKFIVSYLANIDRIDMGISFNRK